MRRCLTRAACVCVIVASTPGIVLTHWGPAEPSGVSVCLVLSPGLALPADIGQRLLPEVRMIWSGLGVDVRSVERADDRCRRIVSVKADHEAHTDLSHGTALGWVPFLASDAHQVVFLRVSRAKLLVDAVSPGQYSGGVRSLMLAKFLGRILAHELGHVLLNSPQHAMTGLMRPHYQAADVYRLPVRTYGLDPSERARLFAELSAPPRLATR